MFVCLCYNGSICDCRMLDLTGLASSMHVRVSQLSGGQRRRLCVALAFIGGSSVVILDEPSSGVDPAARRCIWDLITTHREGLIICIYLPAKEFSDIMNDKIKIYNIKLMKIA